MSVDLRAVKALVGALEEERVRYLVVGGLAVRAHGYLRETQDIDLVLHLSPENVRAGLKVLARYGYKPLLPVAAEEFADPSKRQEWIDQKGATVFRLYSDQHPTTNVDLFVTEPFDFDRAHADGFDGEIARDTTARVVALDDLIAMKEEAVAQAGRPKDLADLRQLHRIRERIREDEQDCGPNRSGGWER